MKKINSLFRIIIFLTMLFDNMLYADSSDLQQLIKIGLKKNYKKIFLESASLSEREKQYLYFLYEKTTAGNLGSCILNTIPGCGLGSFIQGDRLAGHKQLLTQGVGAVLMFGGLYTAMTSTYYDDGSSSGQNKEEEKGLYMFFAGFLFYTISKVYGIFHPFYYASEYNHKLQSVLRLRNIYGNIEWKKNITLQKKGKNAK